VTQKEKPICKTITFSCDGLVLKGVLHLPGNPQPPVVIGAHGLFSSGSSPKQIALAERCQQYGIAFFRLDHRGCGDSQGVFSKVTSLEARCNDLRCAVNTILSRDDTGNKFGLFGSSLGGTVCIASASQLRASAFVTVAAPVRIRSNTRVIEAIEKSADAAIPDASFFQKNLLFDISENISDAREILIFHGDTDEVIPVSHAREIWQKAGGEKKLIIQKGGDHRISHEAHQEQFIREASDWLRTHLL